MVVISDILVQGVHDAAGAAARARRLLTGFVRKVKPGWCAARALRFFQPYRTCCGLLRKEVVLAENASWLFRVTPM